MTLALVVRLLAALGLAVATLVATPTRPAGRAAHDAADLHLRHLSGRSTARPTWIVAIAHAFPLYYLAQAFEACFAPQTTGGGWAPATWP